MEWWNYSLSIAPPDQEYPNKCLKKRWFCLVWRDKPAIICGLLFAVLLKEIQGAGKWLQCGAWQRWQEKCWEKWSICLVSSWHLMQMGGFRDQWNTSGQNICRHVLLWFWHCQHVTLMYCQMLCMLILVLLNGDVLISAGPLAQLSCANQSLLNTM